MRVLLMQSKYSYQKDVPLIVEMPLGLCYLAAVLRDRRHTVRILDCLAEGYANKEVVGNTITYGLPNQEIIRRVENFDPDIVGCSALFTLQYGDVRKLCRLVKEVNSKITTVVGGMHATVKPREVLSDENVDFILRGEADYTFSELVDALENSKDYRNIDGVGYKDGGEIYIREKEKFIGDLDELPLPARDLLNIDNYFEAGLAHGFILKSNRNINLVTSRGCPGGCVFCTIHLMWGKRFRARSPENVLTELKQLKSEFGTNHVQFEDDNLTFDIPRAKTIFRKMIEEGLDLKWNTPNGVALWRMDKETLDLMKRAGCYYLKFAVESGNQRVLSEVIKKPQNLGQIIPLIDHARKTGLKVGSFFVVGLPGETKEEMQESFDFPRKVKLDWAEYSIATPHHGTELRKICEDSDFLKEHKEIDLYARKGLIDTPEFSADWLENKVLEESRRYLKHLMFHQPLTLLTQGWEISKRNPFFVLKYLLRIFKYNILFGSKNFWKKNEFLIGVIIISSLLVRVLGINFNLPYIEFTDELSIGRYALKFAQTWDYKDVFFFYPPLHTYFQGLAIFLYSRLRGIPVVGIAQADAYYVFRLVVAFFGGLSVYIVYRIAEQLTGRKRVGLLAATFFGANLTHVAYSQLVKNDVPSLFFGLICVFFALRILQKGEYKWYLLSGFFGGLSFANLYSAVLYFVPLLAAHLVRELKQNRLSLSLLISPHLGLGFLGFFGGFCLGNPVVILNTNLFIQHLKKFQHSTTVYNSPLPVPAWRWYLSYLWKFGLYYPVLLLSLIGIIISLKKHLSTSLVLLSFITVYGSIIFTRDNYYTDRLSLPLIPPLTIFAGVAFFYLSKIFIKFFAKRRGLARWVVIFSAALLIILLYLRVGIVSYQMAQPTPLQAMENWFDENVPSDTGIFFTATGGGLAFSPNTMEEKYKLIYYYPEVIYRPPEALSLICDYVILYWVGNLPQNWVSGLVQESRLVEEFPARTIPEELGFLNAYATVRNPFTGARARSGFQSGSLYALPSRPADSYGIVTDVKWQETSLIGEFVFVPGTEGEEVRFIYSTDFVLVSGSGAQKVPEVLKSFGDAEEYRFGLDVDKGAVKLDKAVKDSRVVDELRKNLERRLNLKSSLSSEVLGRSGKDYCSLGGPCRPSGGVDEHLRISKVKKKIKRIAVSLEEDTWMGPFNGAFPDIYFELRNGVLDLYFEPIGQVDEEIFQVVIYYEDGTISLLEIKNEGSDYSLKVPRT